MAIITVTTVGFGDYYPRTLFGRIIDVFLIIWGSFIISILVIVLTNYLNIDQAEKRSLIILRRL
jgi:potassium intermediate/small conductance calcium-activated channel subfamily N protein 2